MQTWIKSFWHLAVYLTIVSVCLDDLQTKPTVTLCQFTSILSRHQIYMMSMHFSMTHFAEIFTDVDISMCSCYQALPFPITLPPYVMLIISPFSTFKVSNICWGITQKVLDRYYVSKFINKWQNGLVKGFSVLFDGIQSRTTGCFFRFRHTVFGIFSKQLD